MRFGITSMRTALHRQAAKTGTLRSTSFLLSLALEAGVAGCAPATPPKAAVQAAPSGTGTILAVREVGGHAAAEPLRAALLSDGSGYDGGNGSQVEFIVRSDEGATLSIVQANEPGFRKGDRVVILRDDRTRLARPD
jgi:hypothetical protein